MTKEIKQRWSKAKDNTNKLTLEDLIRETARNTELTIEESRQAIVEFLDVIKEKILEGNTIRINEFGVFKTRVLRSCDKYSGLTGAFIPGKIVTLPNFIFSEKFKTETKYHFGVKVITEEDRQAILERRKEKVEEAKKYVERNS